MANQWPAPIFTDDNLSVAEACSLPVLSCPIPGVNVEYLLTQEFQQNRVNFAPLALNTAHASSGLTPDFSAFLLVGEGPRQDVGNGQVKWMRTYALTPGTHNEYESYSYNFIGFWGWAGGPGVYGADGQVIGRERFSDVVRSRVQNDYYLVNGTGSEGTHADPAGSAGGTAFSVTSIPIIPKYVYYQGLSTVYEYVNFIWDIADGFSVASSPTRTAYKALVAAGTEIAAENSRLSRWMGNIWLRQTRYVVAQ